MHRWLRCGFAIALTCVVACNGDSDLATKIDTLEVTAAAHDTRLSAAETSVAGLETRLTAAETSVAGLETRLTAAEAILVGHGTRLTATEASDTDHEGRLVVLESTPSSSSIFLVHVNPGGNWPSGAAFYLGAVATASMEAQASMPLPRAASVGGMELQVGLNTLNGDTVFTIRKNGADTVLQITVSAGSTGSFSDADTVTFAAGDLLSIEMDTTGASTGGINEVGVGVSLQ